MTRLQKIIDKIQQRLGEIQQANGYRTDAGLRTVLISVEADPLREYSGQTFNSGLVIQVGGSETLDDQGKGPLGPRAAVILNQEVVIYGFRRMPADRSDWFVPSQELTADIKEALFSQPEDRRFFKEAGIESIRFGTQAGQVPGSGAEFIGVEIPIEIIYTENLSQPWEP